MTGDCLLFRVQPEKNARRMIVRDKTVILLNIVFSFEPGTAAETAGEHGKTKKIKLPASIFNGQPSDNKNRPSCERHE
jgi:hypothetical protein